MKVNVENMLRQAGQCARSGCKNFGGMYDYSLQELAANLRALSDRHKAGDMKAVEEFFSIYVFDEKVKT